MVKDELKKIAKELRIETLSMLVQAGSGHPGGSLGMADVFTSLFFDNVMKYDPQNPSWDERDYFVLSNGHICPIMYATLAKAGYFPMVELGSLRKFGSRLQGHPHRSALVGLETTSGPLGSGISQAAGMALGLKIDNKPNRVFCAVSDGEHDEGNTWEGVMFAAKYKLDNLICVMDKNGIQLSGGCDEIMPLGDLRQKYESFNWEVVEVDGHDFEQIKRGFSTKTQKPLMIIANTTLGKGVSFMENDFNWHGKVPSGELAVKAIKELKL